MKLCTIFSYLIWLYVVNETHCNECGQLKSDSSQFPWNVGIYLENQNQAELICFGTVIQSNAILTAAHCFCDNLGGTLRTGTFYYATDNLKKKIDLKPLPSNLHKINKSTIVIHKYYKGVTSVYANDIAIVKDKFQFDNKIKPVCVDWASEIHDNNAEAKQPVWNKNAVVNVDQTYLDEDECSLDAPKDFSAFLTADKSCTKTKTTGIRLSRESEGAAVVFLSDNRWYVKGVISMHEVNEGRLSTYTPTSQYMNWIANICAS